MSDQDAVIGMFETHQGAEAAVKTLAAAGFAMQQLSVIGKGYHTEESVTGFYNVGDKMKVWGRNGAFWGGLWGLFVGGMLLTIPIVGHVVLLGFIAAAALSAAEGAVGGGGLGVLGAALASIGVPKDSVLRYETAIKADSFLVMAHGDAEAMTRARAVLGTIGASRIDAYPAHAVSPEPVAALQH